MERTWRNSTLERIDSALEVVDRIEKEHKEKFNEIGLKWPGYGQPLVAVFEEASKETHYSVSTLIRYRGERRARKGIFSNTK